MELIYENHKQETIITYGETLSASLKKNFQDADQVIILANQRYYNHFYEKISRLFLPLESDWFICRNHMYCNDLTEFSDVINFLERFSKHKKYLLLGFGNEGIMNLTGFVQKNSVLNSEYWLLPVSVRSFTKGLQQKVTIVKKPDSEILQTCNFPERIIFDQSISEAQIEGKLADLLVFITCGLLMDHTFLRTLYKNYPNYKQLQNRSFAALTPQILYFYQQKGVEIEEYGQLFATAFYQTENGHLLSDTMKQFYGLLFHLLWNQAAAGFSFQLKNFFIWLWQMGLPVVLPKEISLTEYLENVRNLQEEEKKLLFLTEIGKIGDRRYAKETELVQAMEAYRQIIAEIRGI